RPAADPDRQPRAGRDQGRGAPGEGVLPLLRPQARQVRRARLLEHPGEIRRGQREVQRVARQVTTRLGVCRWPVAHSLSPRMHTAALAVLGLRDWRYQRLPLPPELFEAAVRALPALGFRGVNATIPHKEGALALADRASESARAIGAANTLTFEPDGSIHA